MLEIGLDRGRVLVIFGLTVFSERDGAVEERTYPSFVMGRI
jgi:hypothetical protein